MQGTERQYATTRERVVAPDGSTTIDVAVDKGSEGVKTFKCRLDASSRFVDVVPTTSDGAAVALDDIVSAPRPTHLTRWLPNADTPGSGGAKRSDGIPNAENLPHFTQRRWEIEGLVLAP